MLKPSCLSIAQSGMITGTIQWHPFPIQATSLLNYTGKLSYPPPCPPPPPQFFRQPQPGHQLGLRNRHNFYTWSRSLVRFYTKACFFFLLCYCWSRIIFKIKAEQAMLNLGLNEASQYMDLTRIWSHEQNHIPAHLSILFFFPFSCFQ